MLLRALIVSLGYLCKRSLCEESLKTPYSRPILIYFELRSKPSLITVICIDPHSPNKLFAPKFFFSYSEMIRISFSLFLHLFFDLLFYVIMNFSKKIFIMTILLLFFFMKISNFHEKKIIIKNFFVKINNNVK